MATVIKHEANLIGSEIGGSHKMGGSVSLQMVWVISYHSVIKGLWQAGSRALSSVTE